MHHLLPTRASFAAALLLAAAMPSPAAQPTPTSVEYVPGNGHTHAEPQNASSVPGQTDTSWQKYVTPEDRAQTNPYAQSDDAAAAGAILFHRSCAGCHGDNAEGRGSRPSLRTPHVQNATDGELHWLLTNGNLRRGMPAWSRLPDAQRWQLVRYLRTLPTPP